MEKTTLTQTTTIDFGEPRVTENARRVLEARYLKKDEEGRVIETPKELYIRVANAVASCEAEPEQWTYKFYDMMARNDFMPNTPCLMNAGKNQGTLFACFVLPIEDNMQSIFGTMRDAALVHKEGGGTGFDFSKLRPKGSTVKSTHGISSGPVSFMSAYNAATEVVKQGSSRRGANMGILRVDHPDIMEFISCKSDTSKITNFNISVTVTDEFMMAVKEGREFDLVDPHTGKKTLVLAKEVMDKIVEQAHATGEPGIIFIDRVNDKSPCKDYELIASSNPCVTGDTWVMTESGPYLARDLVNRNIGCYVDGILYNTKSNGFFSSGCKKVYSVQTKAGFNVKVTEDHKIMTNKGWKKCCDLKIGDMIRLQNHKGLSWPGPLEFGKEQGYLIGYIIGDGCMKHENGKDLAEISVWNKDNGSEGVLEYIQQCVEPMNKRSDYNGGAKVATRECTVIHLKALTELCVSLGLQKGNKTITEAMERCSYDFYCGLIAGLFDADGTIQIGTIDGSRNSIRLNQSNRETLVIVQRMLSRMGILSSIYKRRDAGYRKLPDSSREPKNYFCKENYELIITSDNIRSFHEQITLANKEKQEKIQKIVDTFGSYKRKLYSEVSEIEELDVEEVFDVTVDNVHAFDANGIYVSNCGEQMLGSYDSCVLGSINVGNMLLECTYGSDDRDWEELIDWDRLSIVSRLGTRFLDNMITVSGYTLPAIEEKTKANRRIGLGIMGLADLLVRLGIPYDSNDALVVSQKILSCILDASMEESEKLAEEKGVFPNWEKSEWAKEGKRLRNLTLTTIAPTGSISIIAGCSSGIEPHFAIAFEKNVLDGQKLIEINQDFENCVKKDPHLAEKYTEIVEKVSKTRSIAEITEIPEKIRKIFRTTDDISIEYHIRHQAVAQLYFSHSAVSKTINMPKTAKKEDVFQAYMLAYELGCKGVTVYRDGSRPGQVLDLKKEKTQKGSNRPQVLQGFTDMIKTGYGTMYVTVNEKDGSPFEVFATIGKSAHTTTADAEAISRLISLALRSGVPVQKIIKQLHGIGGSSPMLSSEGVIGSIPDAIAKVLARHYTKEIIFSDSLEENCQHCGTKLVHSNGCSSCPSCGNGKCG